MAPSNDNTREFTVEEVCAIVATCIGAQDTGGPADVDADTELLLTGMLDSLTIVKIVAELERRLDVSIPESIVVARNFRSPTTLHRAVVEAREAVAS